MDGRAKAKRPGTIPTRVKNPVEQTTMKRRNYK